MTDRQILEFKKLNRIEVEQNKVVFKYLIIKYFKQWNGMSTNTNYIIKYDFLIRQCKTK